MNIKNLKTKIKQLKKEISYARATKNNRCRLAGKIIKLIKMENDLEELKSQQPAAYKPKYIWIRGCYHNEFYMNIGQITEAIQVDYCLTISKDNYTKRYILYAEEHEITDMDAEYAEGVKFDKDGMPFFTSLNLAKKCAEEFAEHMVWCLIQNEQESIYLA